MFVFIKSQNKLLNLEQVVEVRLEENELVFLTNGGTHRVDFPTPEEARKAFEALATEIILKEGAVHLWQR